MTDCSVERTRRSGPGGQHRNKVETAIVLTHRPTGIRGEASERRSQAENLAQAQFRLRVALALRIRAPAEACPSPLWQSRIAGRRTSVSPQHDDFPALLAELLDMLAGNDWSANDVSQHLGISASQVVKLLKLEHEALLLVNAHRARLGLHLYR